MNALRLLHLGLAALMLGGVGAVRATQEEDEKAETVAQMHRVWKAIMAFKKDRGKLPDYLSDLVPGYLPNGDVLVSPTEKRTGRRGGDNNYKDPKIRSSFCYEFSAMKFGGGPQTFRELKETQMEEFGPVVPILRSFVYKRRLNVAYSGDIYETDLYWEKSAEGNAVTARVGTGTGFKNGEFAATTIVDGDSGAPLADAEVRLTARSYHGLPLPDRVLRTAADGTVRIPLGPAEPPSRRLTVAIAKPGYFAPVEAWKEGALPEEVVINLERGSTVGGVVKLNDGAALAKAEVEVTLVTANPRGKATETLIARSVTGADGAWSCDQLPKKIEGLTLRISHPAAWTTSFRGAEEPGAENVSLRDLTARTAELRLPAARVLRGKVTDAQERPLAGVEIFAVGQPQALTKTDAEGRYALPWGEAGKVTLLAFPAEGTPGILHLDAAAEALSHDFELKPGRTIRGRILDEGGKPVGGAKVIWRAWEGSVLPVPKTVAETDAEGNFSWASAPSESVKLLVVHEGFYERETTAGAEQTGLLSVRMYRDE